MNIRALDLDQTRGILERGLLIDLRTIAQWIDRHIFGCIPLLYEPGPGFATRARDLLPFDWHLVLLEDGLSPIDDAADRLKGKGFDIAGYLPRGINAWPDIDELLATRVLTLDGDHVPSTLVHVGDPGTLTDVDALSIPAEHLWDKSPEIGRDEEIGVLAGFGVRAAAAVGILEKLGFTKVSLVRTRPEGDRPITAGPDSFRIGGPG